MLESLDSDCILYYEGYFKTLKEELALKLDVSEEDIDMTLAYFTQCGLIQIDEEQNAELTQAKALIQQETNHASYMRNYRKEQQEKEEKLTMLSDNLTTLSDCKTEIDINNNYNYNKTVIGSSLSEILKNIGIHITDRQLEQLLDYVSLDGMSIDMLDYAIEITSNAPKPSFRYLNAILENWKKEGLTTLEQVQVEEYEESDEFPF